MKIEKKQIDKFLQEEIRNDYKITREFKLLWANQIELLFELDRVCKKLGLNYYACGGTLIGAVRHKGFIPWDDDIDVFMLRKDYEKLKELADKEFDEKYFFQNTYTDKIVRQHAQLRKKGTTCLVKGDYGKKYNKGIFLDIFILDDAPENLDELPSFQHEIKEKYARLIPPRKRLAINRNPMVVNIFNFIVYPIQWVLYSIKMMLLGGKKKAFKKFEELAMKYSSVDAKNIGDFSFLATLDKPIFCFDKEKYVKSIDLDFEFFKIPCPSNYDEALKKQYGDYHKFVKGTSLHGSMFVDFSHDYKKYEHLSRKEFNALFDKDWVE